ncbi:MAG TPA: hypothetical protein DCS93_38705 [Microscillaceae bacterium]|nr:hypothetical protein [Microscillaceae bacterium]
MRKILRTAPPILLFWLTVFTIQAQTINTFNISGSPFCAGQTIMVNFSISGTFNAGNTFRVELSGASGSFATPTTIGTLVGTIANPIFATIPSSTPTGTGYKVRVVSNDPVVIGSSTANFEVTGSAGDPTLFGNGFWYAHTYIDNNWGSYVGFFQTNADLNINTTNYYSNTQSPDNFGGFIGCGNVPDDNYSISFKRTNFPCGKYQINIPNYDDRVHVYVDGVQVVTTNACCLNLNSAWTGYLGPNSEVEVRYAEFTGIGFLDFELVKIGDFENVFTLTSDPVICSGSSTNLSVTSSVISGMTYSWSPATGLSTTTGASVTANPTATTTYTVTGYDPATGCSENRDVIVTVSTSSPTITVTPANPVICVGGTTTLSAGGANTYTWSPATGLSATTGSTVTANPATTTTYTVTGDDGCGNTGSQTVTVTVGSPVTNDNIYGDGEWRAYAYDGNFTTLRGYYTQTSLNFNSTDVWSLLGSPSDATGYVGCTVGNDNHSVSYKRTNFLCAVYQIDINNHDDQYWLYIDGVQVSTHNGCCDSHPAVWTGILGPNSQVEFRWREGGGGSRGHVTFTEVDLITTTDPTICPASSTVLNAVNDPGATYSWTPTATLSGANTATVTATPAATTTYTLTATKDGCTVTDNITVTVDNVINLTVAPTTASICQGESVTFTANGAETYTWSPATGLNTTTGNTVIATPSTTTTYTLVGSTSCDTETLTVTVNVTPVPGDPTVFGNGVWNAYCYDGNNFNTYQGMYTETDLSFDTRNDWGSNASPSDHPGFSGCPIPNDQHSVVYKRTNFTCGYYQIDVSNHDDHAFLYIDGVEVFSHLGCCDSHTNVWTGYLGPASTVEFRWREFGGGSHGGLTVTDLSSTLAFTSPDVTICETTTTNLTASLTGTNITWATDPTYISLSANSGNAVVATALPGANGTRTVTATATDPTTGCQIVRTINITVDPLANTQVSATSTNICLGESVTLTATGANTYSWSPSATLSAATGYAVTATPTAAGSITYTVTGSNNCNTKDVSVTVNVLGPTLSTSEFGDGKWNVFCYNGRELTSYYGHYDETSLSFDTRTKWGANNSPSDAPGYIGCPIPNDQHSYIYKRTNFPCGSYRIDIPNHDDDCELIIDGVSVFKHVGCCDSHIGVWTGLLQPSSKVEFIVKEGGGGSHGGLNIGFSQATTTTFIWTGEFNDDWFNALNWCQGVPDATTDVIIPGSGVPNWPIINANGAVCKSFTIETGGQLTINGAYELEVHGSWTNNGGTLNMNNSIVNFRGSTNETIGGTNSTIFYNLNLYKPSQKITLGNSVDVNNTLTINDTELNLNQNKITINNPSNTAIVRSGNGFINSEASVGSNSSIVSWYTGTNIASYVFPFGVSSSVYIPVTFNKKVNANTTISISTRGTGVDNLPLVPGVTLTGISGADASTVVDRWWDIRSTVNPLPAPGANVTLSYPGTENTLPDPLVDLAIQHYNASINDWDSPYANSSVGIASGIGTVTAVDITSFSPHVISMASLPLPADFLQLSVATNKDKAYLDWITSETENVDYFAIERSDDGIRYQTIAKMDGKKGVVNYQWVDREPLSGTSYYRVAQFNSNNTFAYSPLQSINLDAQKQLSLTVSPNPIKGRNIGVQLSGLPTETKVGVKIYNAQGQTVYQQDVKVSPTLVIRTSQKLSGGVYILEANTGRQLLRTRFIVVND